jgi:hypothetical protein
MINSVRLALVAPELIQTQYANEKKNLRPGGQY